MATTVPPLSNIFSIPIDKHFNAPNVELFDLLGFFNPFNTAGGEVGAAFQSGVVRLKVLINRTCPFRKSPFAEYALVFNDRTVSKFPKFITDKIRGYTGVGGPEGADSFTLEGVSLLPKYIYRHNFIREKAATSTNPAIDLEPLAAVVTQQPLYKENTTWLITDTVFTGSTPDPAGDTSGCNEAPDFEYVKEEIESSYGQEDIDSDYGTGVESPNLSDVQVVHMHKSQTCARNGIHWRLESAEKSFKGQDFFFRFFERAESPDLPAGNLAPQGFAKRGLGFDYDYLDATNPGFETSDGSYPANQAVAAYTINPGTHATKKETGYDEFVLSNQAYIIIEMGIANPAAAAGDNDNVGQHYFIIITARAHPIFVVEENGITHVLSVYTPMLGRNLLGKDFGLTVQHWLGKMVVTFDGPNMSAPPWIIERRIDRVEEGNSVPDTKLMVVSNAPIAIWGGNMPMAFVYGPLQYEKSFAFNLPPKAPIAPPDGSSVPAAPADVSCATLDALSLPLPSSAHRLTFSVTDAPIDELPNSNEPVYTADAQQFIDFSPLANDADATTGALEVNGKFFQKPNYRAVGPTLSRLIVKKEDKCEDEARRNQKFIATIIFESGSHKFDNTNWILPTCKNPIVTTLRLLADDPDQVSRWETDNTCRDVTDHVLTFEESWVAQDFNSMEHTGNISFLLHSNPLNPLPETAFLEGLKNKAFYIEVWAGYRDCNYSQIGNGTLWKLFTGMCEGGSVELTPGRKVMNCQISDYTKVLSDQRLFNSPFFDGVKDIFAIHELLSLAGFRDGGGTGATPANAPEKPAALLKFFTNQQGAGQIPFTFGDGRTGINRPFALPSGYSRIQDPKFKFADSSTFLDAIKKITRTSGKLFYFDQYGLAHYENYLDEVINSINPNINVNSLVTLTNFWFTTNPTFAPGQLVFNQASRYFNVADIRNHIKILSNTPNFTPTYSDDLSWDSIDKPDTEGFLGYLRTFYQEEGALGSQAAMRNILSFYRSLFRPPIVVKFETYGLPTRALDLVVFDKQIFRVMRVNSTIDATRNVWWQEYECEWFQAAESPTGVAP